MGIDLGGGDGGMPEHGLDGAYVGTVLEEVGSEAVTQGVWMDIFYDASLGGIVFHESLDAAWGKPERFATALFGKFREGDEKCRIDIISMLQISLERRSCFGREEDDAELGTLTSDAELFFLQIDVVAIETGEFGDTESGREEEFEDGVVTEGFVIIPIGSGDESLDLIVFEVVNLTHRGFANLDFLGGNTFDIIFSEEFQERSEDDDMESLGNLLEILSSTVLGSIEENPVLANLFQGDIAWIFCSRPSQELFQGAVIVGEGAWRTVKLDLEMFEIALYKFLEGGIHTSSLYSKCFQGDRRKEKGKYSIIDIGY